jgi:hypothetical protein
MLEMTEIKAVAVSFDDGDQRLQRDLRVRAGGEALAAVHRSEHVTRPTSLASGLVVQGYCPR